MRRRIKAPCPLLRLVVTFSAGWLAGEAPMAHAGWDEFADAVETRLARVSPDGERSLQISGRLDLTGYHIPEPVADLRYTAPDTDFLVSPVLQVFADARLSPQVQARAQVRVDRGFDPADKPLESRVEEMALRLAPWPARRVSLQVGRFATVFGSWARRRHAWDYPFITAPLAQESLTGLWDVAAPPGLPALQRWAHVDPVGDAAAVVADERRRIPVMWDSVYATGAALSFGGRRWDLSVEIKNTGLSSRPDTWDEFDAKVWRDPASAARLGWRPATGWDLGISWSRGIYVRPEPAFLAAGRTRGDYVQTTLSHDLTYAWRHFQFWGEIIASRFEVPGLGDADTLAYSLEAQYRFTPRWTAFLRWSQQFYLPLELADGEEESWGRDAWRIEAGPALRLAAHAQLKFQAGLLHERPSTENLVPSAALQLSLRF